LTPIWKINRRCRDSRTVALMVPALKSRARINRRCRDEEVLLLHLFFKDHLRTAGL
jgi:hypothetical protein